MRYEEKQGRTGEKAKNNREGDVVTGKMGPFCSLAINGRSGNKTNNNEDI